MEKYEMPELEIIEFESEAAVITSIPCGGVPGDTVTPSAEF